MKSILITICNLILILPGHTQVSWFPIGAKWHYQFSSMFGGGLTTLEVLNEDTLIANHVYKKLLSTTIIGTALSFLDTFTEILYVFEENQVVFGYDKWAGGTLLYDFNANVEDTLGMYFGGWSPSPFIVDSIGTIDINGHSLTFQDIRFPSLYDTAAYDKMRVIEGMGSINSHLFHDHTVIQPIDFPFYYFRCYEDPNIGLVNLSHNQVDCDYIEGVTSVYESIKVKTSIFPNPSVDFVTIKTGSPILEKVYVIDILGRVRKVQHTTPQELLKIDITELNNGIYLILGGNNKGKILFTEKIIKYGS